MGKLTLYTGSLGSYYYFKDKALEHLSGSDPDSFLYLLPVNRSVRYLKKKLVAETGPKSLLEPLIFSFRSFIRDLYNHYPEKKKVISPSMRLLLLQHILNKEEHDLSYFQKSDIFGNGLVLKADQMLDEFFQFGFRPGDFTKPPSTAEKKFSDFSYLITTLFDVYQNKLIDESSLLGETFSFLTKDAIQDYYPRLSKVYISGFGIYSPPMFRLIDILKENCDVEIKLEYDAENEELFKHTTDAYERLSIRSDQIINLDDDQNELNQRIFKSTASSDQLNSLSTNIEIYKLHSRVDEINFIATKIKQLHHQANMPLHKIGITFPDLEKYVPLIKKLFKDYDIPFNLSTGFSLAESPLIQSFMQVLRIVISGFQTDEVFKLAISPFLKQNLLHEANLIRQSARKIRLNHLQGNWEQRIRKLIGPMDDDEALTQIRGKIPEDQLNRMLENISGFLLTIKPLSEKLSAEKFQSVYTEVLKGLGLMEWYQQDQVEMDISDKEKEYRAFNRFIKLMDQIVWILKYLHGKNPIDIQDYFNILTIVFENATYNLREWSDYGVQIMPRLEILSLDLETLFIGGLVEGDFPRHFTRDIFFNDEERAQIGLNASEDLLGQDRFLFFQLITCGAKYFKLSYPQFESEANLLPSTFLTNLQQIVKTIDVREDLLNYNFLSRSSLPEYLSKSLKSGLNEEEKYLYRSWINYESPQKIDYWYKGIRSQYARRSYGKVTPFEGNLTNSGAVHRTLEESYLKKSFSITALESYAFCPMQYFLQRVVSLEAEEEIEASITSLERGNLIHKVLYKFYQNLTPEERIKSWEYGDLLKSIATDTFEILPYRDILWQVEKEKYFGSPLDLGLWDKFLQTEKEYLEQTGFIPSYFESDFGYLKKGENEKPNIAPLVIKHQKNDIKIYGKIDRIDIDKNGRFSVIDYKSGQGAMKITTSDMLDGMSLQLPVYIAAARQLLRTETSGSVPAAGMYYQVQDADNCRTKFVLVNEESGIDLPKSKSAKKPVPKDGKKDEEYGFDEIIDHSLDFISHYVDSLSKGNFPHTTLPKDYRCTSYCSFKRICRKDTGKLTALQE
jgi:ATP-dependent helicase/DNAse subunit B